MNITPEQFNKLAFKDDLQELKEEITEAKKERGEILTAVDGIAKNFERFEHELLSNQAAHDRFENRISNLEKGKLKLKNAF